jgi:hypothetical protein
MKEENHGDGTRTPGNSPNPNNANRGANDAYRDGYRQDNHERKASGLSKPPQRDMSGKRIDLDGWELGYEIW